MLDWVADAVFYQIFPDRFAIAPDAPKPAGLEPWDAPPTLHGFKGGDLDGARARLDHIVSLGATAIYLNPVFASTANHRYHTHDYHRVDPILGGDAALRRLIDDAHARGLRVILDGVFNHASRGFYQFNHTLENGAASPYVDWFHFDRARLDEGRAVDAYGAADQGYRSWWDLPALPKLNTDNPEVRAFLFDVAERWVDFGIDGWRLDVPNEIDDAAFWREFRQRVKARNPDAYIVGEIWDDASRWLQGDQFDGVTNYLFARLALGHLFPGGLDHAQLDRCGLKGIQPIGAEAFAEGLAQLWRAYPRDAAFAQLNLVGSHDTPRLSTMGCGDMAGVKLVYTALFAFPGAPCIYYGDEVGMPGDHDPDCRRGFDWSGRSWNQDLLQHVRACAAARKQSVALRRGDFAILHARDGMTVIQRRCGNAEAIVALNAGVDPCTVELTRPHGAGAGFAPALPDLGRAAELAARGERLRLHLPPRAGQIWVGRDRS